MKTFGLIGVGLMGENLTLNIESKGYSVAVYDIDKEKVNRFINGRAKNKKISGAESLQDLVTQLERPRKIMMMIQAGSPVDQVIEGLIPFLSKGDIILTAAIPILSIQSEGQSILKKKVFTL
jgi:6-phosphogluconate dehydrogenase